MKARIYTKTGDGGETSLVGGTRVSKANPRLGAYGTLDELNSVLGLVRAHLHTVPDENLRRELESRLHAVQDNLFNIGSHLANEDASMKAHLPGVRPETLASLEGDLDRWEQQLPALREFILPGGTLAASFTHLARTVCRRAERHMIALRTEKIEVEADHLVYVNRLSDWLFLLARVMNHASGVRDVTWTKG